MAFPEDSIQYVLDDWWQQTTKCPSPQRGELIKVMVPFKIPRPTRLVAKRKENQPGDHECVDFVTEQYSIETKLSRERLPIAGLPDIEDGSYALYPYKKRPALVLASAAEPIDHHLTAGLAGYQKTPCLIVVPYYGTDKNGKRGGYPERLLQSVRKCQYPHFFWDCLPLKGDTESSLLRIDSMFAVVNDRAWYQHTGFKLSQDAMEIMTEYVGWFLTGELPPKSLIRDLREGLDDLGKM